MRNQKNKSLRVLITHPYVGSEWLFNAKVDEDKVRGFASYNRHPIGQVWTVDGYPKSCIKKVEIHEGEPLKEWNE